MHACKLVALLTCFVRCCCSSSFFPFLSFLVGTAQLNNALGLSASELKQRGGNVTVCDICDDKQTDMVATAGTAAAEQEDPKRFVSKKRPGVGPLKPGTWAQTLPADAAVCCVYSVVRLNVDYWGVRSIAERWILRNLADVFFKVQRKMYCWQDAWLDELTVADALRLELAEPLSAGAGIPALPQPRGFLDADAGQQGCGYASLAGVDDMLRKASAGSAVAALLPLPPEAKAADSVTATARRKLPSGWGRIKPRSRL
jgi:hypothetical protein